MGVYRDIKGEKFGKLTVISISGKNERGVELWKCICECGGTKEANKRSLMGGKLRSCGCLQLESSLSKLKAIKHIGYRNDIVGKKFGRLTAIMFSHSLKKYAYWKFLCECGNIKVIRGTHVTSGLTLSCGCFRNEQTSKALTTHGHYTGRSQTSEICAWKNLKERCLNKKDKGYENYGGRGIKICDRWMKFENFYADMGDRPSDKHSIDRINNDGNYEPSNCKWSTRTEQNSNTRRNRYYTYGGETLTIMQWGRKLGFNPGMLKSRIKRGASFKDAITRPLRGV